MANEKINVRTVAIGVVVVVVAAVVAMRIASPRAGLPHYKNVFELLVGGKPGAAQFIDWENLNAVGFDVGKEYAAFKDKERDAYALSFVRQLGAGFAASGATAEKFVNWRLIRQDSAVGEAAADYPEKNKELLLVFVLKQGAWKLASLQWSGDEQSAE